MATNTEQIDMASTSSRFSLSARTLSFVVLFFAIFISAYLSYLKIDSGEPAICLNTGSFDCGVVLNSAYSELAGIPIAWLGLATNLIVLSLLILEPRVEMLREFGVTLIFGVVLFAFLFSMYLIYVQAVFIEAYCPWCLTHEALITVLFLLSGYRLWRSLNSDEA
ncbi:MAG: vitamin K epoxide reductase family protein [Aggregatilineales bacterium]